MKRVLGGMAVAIALASAATAAAPASIEGRWTNPKGSMVIDVDRCGSAYCGTVVSASEKARANARAGGTANLIGKQLISGFVPDGRGGFKGRVFVPKYNVHAGGSARLVGANTLAVKGCAVAGVLCKEQTWHRVR